MATEITCSKCGKTGKVKRSYLGLPVRCRDCRTKFIAALTSGDYPIGEPAFDLAVDATEHVDFDGEPADRRGGREMPESIGRFQIKAWLGRGGFADVYLAYDPVLDRDVALKVPKAKTLSNPDRIARFLREAKSAASLRHPHIVPVFDSGQDGDHYYIATAFIEGRSLSEALMEKPFDFHQTAILVRALAEALAYAHSQGIVHRDIKPGNIMLDANGVPFLVDFGLAARLGDPADTDDPSQDGPEAAPGEDADPKMTQLADPKATIKRVRMGTPAYWSPEQAAGILENVKASTDQYSLGMVLYEMLCGHPAFSGPPVLLQAHAQKTPPPPPRSIKPEIPEDLEAICLKTLAKNPEERYANCQELANDLRRWLEGEETHVRPLATKERVKRWCQKEPMRAWAIGLAGVALVAVLVLSIVFAVQESRSARHIGKLLTQTEISQRQAEQNERKTKITLAAFTLDRAQMFGEQKETGLAMSWLARSLEIAEDAEAEDLQHVIRRNLSAWQESTHSLRVSAAAPSRIHSIAFHPDGDKLYLGGEGYLVQRRIAPGNGDAEERLLLNDPGKSPVLALAFVAERQKLLFAFDQRILKAVPQAFGKTAPELHPPFPALDRPGKIRQLAVAPDDPTRLAFVDEHSQAWLWDDRTRIIQRLGSYQNVRCLAFSPCGQAILMGCGDGTARLWSVENGHEDWVIPGAIPIPAVAFHPDGKQILLARSAPLSGKAELWSVGKRALLTTFPHQAEVHAVAFSPDGQILVTAGRDRAARLWHTEAPYHELGRTLWHPGEVTHAVFHPTKQALVTVDSEKSVRLWEVKQEKPTFKKRSFLVTAVNAKPDGTVLLVQMGNRVQIEDADGRKVGPSVNPGHAVSKDSRYDSKVTAFAVDEKHHRMLTASELTLSSIRDFKDHVIHLWDIKDGKDGKLLHTFRGHTDWTFRVAISPRGDTAASIGRDGKFFLWDLDAGAAKPVPFPYKNKELFALAYSPDGSKLAVGGTDHVARVFDLDNLQAEPVALRHPNSVLSAVFSPDQKWLLTGYAGGAQLWDLTTGQDHPLQHLTGAFAVAFSPDGTTLATAGTDRHARLWDRATLKQVGPPRPHADSVFTAVLTEKELITVTGHPDIGEAGVHRWPLMAPSEASREDLTLRAKLISNITLDQHNTNQQLDSAAWIKLNKQVKTPDDWRKTWQAWPAPPPRAVPYQPMLPKQVPVVKIEPTKEPEPKKVLPIKEPEPKQTGIRWFALPEIEGALVADPEVYFPARVGVVVQLNVDQIQASSWGKAHDATLDKAQAIIKRWLPDEVAKLLDIARDVDRIRLALDDDMNAGVVIVEGRFEKLRASAKAAGALKAGAVPGLEIQGFPMVFVNDKLLVGATDRRELEAARRRATAGVRKPLPAALVELRKRASGKPSLHVLVAGSVLETKLKVPAETGVLALSATITLGDKVRLEVMAAALDPDTATRLADGAGNGFPSMLKELAKKDREFQPLADAAGTVKTSTMNHYAILRMEMSNAAFDALLRDLRAKLGIVEP